MKKKKTQSVSVFLETIEEGKRFFEKQYEDNQATDRDISIWAEEGYIVVKGITLHDWYNEEDFNRFSEDIL